MLIDAYAHTMPQRYRDALARLGIHDHDFVPPYLCDMDARREFLAPLGAPRCVAAPMQLPLHLDLPRQTVAELARVYNDEAAELQDKNPDLICATVAALPLGDMDDTLREAERALTELHMRGVLLPCNYRGLEPGCGEWRPLMRLMARHDLPVWLHPWPFASSRPLMPDSGGWEMLADTADAMVHAVCSGLFDELPDLKIVVHHGGAFVPFFAERLRAQYFADYGRAGRLYDPSVPAPDHTAPDRWFAQLKNFYADTAFYGRCTPQINAVLNFYGEDHVLFGTDFPLPTAAELEPAIASLAEADLADEGREKVAHGNIERICKLI